jgi:hypothetical protein
VAAKPSFRIFISSPSDVSAEREAAKAVVESLAAEFVYRCKLEAVSWEWEPLAKPGSFPDNLPPPGDCDIVVVLLWWKLGWPLPDRPAFRDPDDGHVLTGTEWEFLDAERGRRESDGRRPDVLVYRKRADPQITVRDDATLKEFQDQRAALTRFLHTHFLDEQGRFIRAIRDVQPDDDFAALLSEHLRRLLRRKLELPESTDTPPPRGNPFQGLASFDVEDAPFFFGRTRERDQLYDLLMNRIDGGRASVLILGPSGSGKSSVAKAGLLAKLSDQGKSAGGRLCRYAVIRAGETAGRPFQALASALFDDQALPELSGSFKTAEQLQDHLAAQPEAAIPAIQEALNLASRAADRRAEHARLAILVDQLEELVGTVAAEDSARFASLLIMLADSGIVWILGTLREDFMHRLDDVPRLRALFAGGQYHLEPPGPTAVSEMIRRPAEIADLTFGRDPRTNRSLATELEEELRADPHALPLLQFVLDSLYEHRTDTGVLRYEDYERMGRVAGAIARKARDVTRNLSQADKTELHAVLRALVTVDKPDAPATAAWVRRADLESNATRRQLIDSLLRERLLVTKKDPRDGAAMVRLAHEALIRSWQDLRQLVEENREVLDLRASLLPQVRDYERSPETAALLSGFRLDHAKGLLDTHGPEAFGRSTAAFIEDSARHRSETEAQEAQRLQALLDAEEKKTLAQQESADYHKQMLATAEQRRRASKRWAGVLCAALLLTAAVAGWAVYQRDVADAKLAAQKTAMALAAEAWEAIEKGARVDGLAKLDDARGHASDTVLADQTRAALLYEIGYAYYRLAEQGAAGSPEEAGSVPQQQIYEKAVDTYSQAADLMPSPRGSWDLARLLHVQVNLQEARLSALRRNGAGAEELQPIRQEAIRLSERADDLYEAVRRKDPKRISDVTRIARNQVTRAGLLAADHQLTAARASYWDAVQVYRERTKVSNTHGALAGILVAYQAFVDQHFGRGFEDPNNAAATEIVRVLADFIRDYQPTDASLIHDAVTAGMRLRDYKLVQEIVASAADAGLAPSYASNAFAEARSARRNVAVLHARLAGAHASLLAGDKPAAMTQYRELLSGRALGGAPVSPEIVLKSLRAHEEAGHLLDDGDFEAIRKLAERIAPTGPTATQTAKAGSQPRPAPPREPAGTTSSTGGAEAPQTAETSQPAPRPAAPATPPQPDSASLSESDVDAAVAAARGPLAALVPFQRERLKLDLLTGTSVQRAVAQAFPLQADPEDRLAAERTLCAHLPAQCE